ncbi:hypothetical protein H5410_003996 [Solanum commersonii]|uniref:Alkaline/neutral invertase n=1 Tax=Solanum commersonii TaxID=4109 RepID=A0A9J6B776_SOLCO|nr:hypothetical protein H5410_003996 [Solanum commersonii]
MDLNGRGGELIIYQVLYCAPLAFGDFSLLIQTSHEWSCSGLWWIILLRAYGRITGDYTLQERVDMQIGFDMFPTLLVTDGSCMIDRWVGIHGRPLEIHSTISSYICHLSSNLWEVVNNSEVSQPAAVDANDTLQKWKIKAGKALFALKTMATPPPRSRLGIQNDTRLQLLESELLSIGQCNMTIAQYFHKVKDDMPRDFRVRSTSSNWRDKDEADYHPWSET